MNAQAGIFEPNNTHQHHLEFVLRADVNVANLARALGQARREDGVAGGSRVVIGFGPAIAAVLCADDVPADFTAFAPVGSAQTWCAPSTQADLWVWVQGNDKSSVLDRAISFVEALSQIARLVLDVAVFQRAENRDFTGFVDGTANPKDDARFAAALIDSGPGEGGSIALTQRWRHRMDAFNARPQREQEAIIGRTKHDDVELEGDAMLDDSHVSRTDVKVDGRALKIYRRSAPYGDAREQGLLFLAFACEQNRIQIQLERMFGVSGDGIHDRIVEFSEALSGSYWYVPPEVVLTQVLR